MLQSLNALKDSIDVFIIGQVSAGIVDAGRIEKIEVNLFDNVGVPCTSTSFAARGVVEKALVMLRHQRGHIRLEKTCRDSYFEIRQGTIMKQIGQIVDER
jgi:hypothetical protein